MCLEGADRTALWNFQPNGSHQRTAWHSPFHQNIAVAAPLHAFDIY
jgi:hypothetical protein